MHWKDLQDRLNKKAKIMISMFLKGIYVYECISILFFFRSTDNILLIVELWVGRGERSLTSF